MSDATAITTPLALDAGLRARLARDGIAPLELLDAKALASLRTALDAFLPRVPPGFVATLLSNDPAVRQQAHLRSAGVLEPALRRAFAGFRLVNAGFAVRAAGSESADMPMHQDWSFVDESRFMSFGVWAPLVNVERANGCLQVVKGSHAKTDWRRGVGGGFAFPELEPLLRERYLSDVALHAGQAVVFDQRLFHCSAPNTFGCDRPVAAAVMLPETAPFLFHEVGAEGVVAHAVPDDFFLRHGVEGARAAIAGRRNAAGR